jgi:Ca-activated chloride channel family protein
MKTFSKIICVALVLAGMAMPSPVWASDEARELALKINDANRRLRSGEVDAAITAYQQASENAPDDSDLTYNLAVAQYRKGDVAAAGRLFHTAAAAEDDAVAAKARYNLGNCNFAAAIRDAEKDRAGAIKSLETAIGNYRSALDVEPTDADARANIERAAALIDTLKHEDKKEHQQRQNKSQQKQQHQEKQDESQESQTQKSDSEQQQNKQEEQQQKEKQNQNNQQQAQDHKPQQQQQQQDAQSSANTKEDEQQKQNQPQAGTQSGEEKSSPDKSEQDKSQQSNQSSAAQNQQQKESHAPNDAQSQPGKSDSQQDKPDDKSRSEQKQQDAQAPPAKSESQQNRHQRPHQSTDRFGANAPEQAEAPNGKTPPKGALSVGNEAANDKKQEQLPSLDVAKEGEMTTQEAEKMLQSIRDREMLRRLRRQAAERERHVPVDRDW